MAKEQLTDKGGRDLLCSDRSVKQHPPITYKRRTCNEEISIRIYYGIAIAVTVRSLDHSLDYYYKPTSAIQIDGLNSYVHSIVAKL